MSKSSAAGLACKLRQLRLTCSSGLYHLPARFAAACAGLQELDLSYSRLTVETAAVLGRLSCCTSLCLAESRLQEVPDSWAALTRLQVRGLLEAAGGGRGGEQEEGQIVLCVQTCFHVTGIALNLQRCVRGFNNAQYAYRQAMPAPPCSASKVFPAWVKQLCCCHGPCCFTISMLSLTVLSCGPQVLDVSGNPLGVLPPFFSRLQALNKLVLASTRLLVLPGFVSSLTSLQHLSLASNKLQVWARHLHFRVGA